MNESVWHCRRRRIPLHQRTLIMGILNVTPDSFSDGGLYAEPDAAVLHGIRMAEEGADILDVGGQSTRPGADPVGLEAEMERVLPVIEGLASRIDLPISIDTTDPQVAREAVRAGAVIINDISGLSWETGMERVAAETRAGLVIMHIRGTPQTMAELTDYRDVTGEVREFLGEQASRALRAGVSPEQIVVDPGIGFAKKAPESLTLLREIPRLASLGYPVLIGPSRKSFLGTVLNLPADQRIMGTAAAVATGIALGARIVRVHDVPEMVQVARTVDAILGRRNPPGEPQA